MASPQKEDGYTPIANELLEALAGAKLSGTEYQVALALIRMTYGYGKKEDAISLSQIAEMTGLLRQNVHRAIKNMSSKMITHVIKDDYNGPLTYGIQKDYSRWCNHRRLHPKVSSKVITTKESNSHRVSVRPTLKNNMAFEFKIRVPLPRDISLTPKMRQYVKDQGASENGHAKELFEDFCNYHGAKGTKWKNWTLAFYKWVRNDKKFHPEKYVRMEVVAK